MSLATELPFSKGDDSGQLVYLVLGVGRGPVGAALDKYDG